MQDVPHDRAVDSTVALLRDPYGFIPKRCARYGSVLFEARLLLEETVCTSGREAARLFYDPRRFRREGAMPEHVRRTLFGKGGVQGLDGATHRRRKRLFLEQLAPARLPGLCEELAHQWRERVARVDPAEGFDLYAESQQMLCRSVCAWAGVALDPSAVRARTRDLGAMFDAAASLGLRYGRAWLGRRRWERELAARVERARAGEAVFPAGSAADAIARATGPEGRPLAPRVAAVEILNVLRPTVALAVYVVFLARALHVHPEARRALDPDDDASLERFVQEVRRFHPFFPMVAARVREDFDWMGYRFPRGRRVLLDLYGTDHDPRIWGDPERFRPERFRDLVPDPFAFVPQGGGDPLVNHRCAGEWVTIALLKTLLRLLVAETTWSIPPDADLRIDMRRLPALPRDGLTLTDVRLREAGDAVRAS